MLASFIRHIFACYIRWRAPGYFLPDYLIKLSLLLSVGSGDAFSLYVWWEVLLMLSDGVGARSGVIEEGGIRHFVKLDA